MSLQPTVKAKLTYPILRGLGVSMLFTAAYLVAFVLAIRLGDFRLIPVLLPVMLASFIPALLVVNFFVATYYSSHYSGTGGYMVGVIVAVSAIVIPVVLFITWVPII